MIKVDFEYILLFKKLGKPPAVSQDQKAAATLTAEEWNTFFAGHRTFPAKRARLIQQRFRSKCPRG